MAKIREAAAGAPKGLPDRATFDETIGHTAPRDDVAFEAAQVGGVPGWWCRPKDASARNVILYLDGGAYVPSPCDGRLGDGIFLLRRQGGK
jgi:monoterpene epsilon-lactone hydrolase